MTVRTVVRLLEWSGGRQGLHRCVRIVTMPGNIKVLALRREGQGKVRKGTQQRNTDRTAGEFASS